MPDHHWYVYIVRCRDNSLYTGIARNLQQRIDEHNHSPKGARYTRGRRPVELVYHETAFDRSSAQRREYQIKQLPPSAKRRLIATQRSTQTHT
ncbi:MAG: GIY-YIG nuclease family protein [Pseudomonadota bacterium]